jgi:hypothetical protein
MLMNGMVAQLIVVGRDNFPIHQSALPPSALSSTYMPDAVTCQPAFSISAFSDCGA